MPKVKPLHAAHWVVLRHIVSSLPRATMDRDAKTRHPCFLCPCEDVEHRDAKPDEEEPGCNNTRCCKEESELLFAEAGAKEIVVEAVVRRSLTVVPPSPHRHQGLRGHGAPECSTTPS